MSEHSESKASMYPSGAGDGPGGADKSRGGPYDAEQGGNPFSIP